MVARTTRPFRTRCARCSASTSTPSSPAGSNPYGRGLARVSRVPGTLVVTNDFPPRPGGIQSYLHALASRLPAHELVVYAPSWEAKSGSHPEFDAEQPFDVVRHPGTLMLPTPAVARRAREIIR